MSAAQSACWLESARSWRISLGLAATSGLAVSPACLTAEAAQSAGADQVRRLHGFHSANGRKPRFRGDDKHIRYKLR
jgi:hypothetical protein